MARSGGKPPRGTGSRIGYQDDFHQKLRELMEQISPNGHRNRHRWRWNMPRGKKSSEWDRAKTKMDEALGEIQTAVDHSLPKGAMIDRRSGTDRRKKQKRGFFRGKMKW